MPVITIQCLELTKEQKEKLADRIITAFAEETIVSADKVYLFFDNYRPEDAACDKKLFSEKYPNYYDMFPDKE